MWKINAVLIAAAVLNLGVGSAFAGEDFPERYQASIEAPAAVVADSHNTGSTWLLGVTARESVDVYAMFNGPGTMQGGQQ
jgi:hypothetical protein